MVKLVMIAPAPVIDLGGRRLRLDVKFVEGLRSHLVKWDGPVTCILKKGAIEIPFGMDCDPEDLGVDLQVVEADAAVNLQEFSGPVLIFASADMHGTLGLAAPGSLPAQARLVYSVEYTLGTRLQIALLDRKRNILRKLYSCLWLLKQEFRRRGAFRACDGVQVNGYPAFRAYRKLNPRTMLYFDSRIGADMMATPKEGTARAARLRSGSVLRIVHSGRLEPMKGAQDLIPVAQALTRMGVQFKLDIFGSGSLSDDILAEIRASGLQDRIRLHAPVDFETELVPYMRQNVDLFLSCHRQADPSCSYFESLGCGVPVLGYDNAMWEELSTQSAGGWRVPMGQTEALAAFIARLDADREEIIKASQAGLEFVQLRNFDAEFTRRMEHLAEVAGAGRRARRKP